jgi:hypothetical protein
MVEDCSGAGSTAPDVLGTRLAMLREERHPAISAVKRTANPLYMSGGDTQQPPPPPSMVRAANPLYMSGGDTQQPPPPPSMVRAANPLYRSGSEHPLTAACSSTAAAYESVSSKGLQTLAASFATAEAGGDGSEGNRGCSQGDGNADRIACEITSDTEALPSPVSPYPQISSQKFDSFGSSPASSTSGAGYNGEPVGGGEYSIWRPPKVSIVDYENDVDVNSLDVAGGGGRSADGFGDNTGAYETWHPSATPEQGRRASGVRRTSGTLAGEASSGERAKW